MRTPVVLIACNRYEEFAGTPVQVVRDTYLHAVSAFSGALPLLLPSLEVLKNPVEALQRVDGLLLTGGNKHVEPALYGAPQEFPDEQLDVTRDAIVLSLLAAAIEADIPTLTICRGFQELNVAAGGTLCQYVDKLPGKLNHRVKKDISLVENYFMHAHKVFLQPGGLFESWGLPHDYYVNSLHEQGIDKLGAGLQSEAVSEDGLIEAVSMPGKRFIVGVQWHPEGDCFKNQPNARLFEKFGESLRKSTLG